MNDEKNIKESSDKTAAAEAAAGSAAVPTAAPVERAPAGFRALIGEKLAMTRVFTEAGESRSATVVRAGPCPVLRVKTTDSKDGYNAVLLGFGARPEKGVNKPEAGQFKKFGVSPVRWLKEVRVPDAKACKEGQIVDLAGRFSPGDYVDVQGVSKGHGFAGVMKRHGFRGLPASHGASDKQRSPGSLTSRRSLGKVLKGQRMAGHFGAQTVTSHKIEVVSVDEANHLIYLDGSVPGARGSQVLIRETVKPRKRYVAPKKPSVLRDKMGNIIKGAGAKARAAAETKAKTAEKK